ncbi:MAG: alanine--tRNA ligase [Candidatus Bathyarchaeota archaeon]|nr:alanine--tRNA ligase [Candidatus Bathyarchaeota archaeon]
MSSETLKKKYIEFFLEHNHKRIANSPLIPENDPTALFISAGMHPLVPYLLGQPNPSGKRLVNVQKCLRTSDIDEVGDSFHLSFFEMLGNWSLGDYFKDESIRMSYEFLTSKKWLNIDLDKLSVTVFAGDENIPRDEVSAGIWKELGVPEDRIYYLPAEDNFWGPVGSTGPCGPDTEIFYDTGIEACSVDCQPGCSCGKYCEIWNNVFMEYNRTPDGKFVPLEQKNVDTGMGVERTTSILQGKDNVYETEIFAPLVEYVKALAGIEEVEPSQVKSIRIIVEHARAATFLLAEGIVPLNTEQGYVLRRMIRKAIRRGKLLGVDDEFLSVLAEKVIDTNSWDYPYLKEKQETIISELKKEHKKFSNTLQKGLNRFNRMAKKNKKISGTDAFLLYQSFGFPIEIIVELGEENDIPIDVDGFNAEFEKHQNVSRAGADKRFGSGLADHSDKTVRLHTATHLLNEALRKVLGDQVEQRGSNITPERLRFDFNFHRKVTKEELQQVEDLVNEQIEKAIPVEKCETTFEKAKEMGAQAVFEQRYGDKITVYSIGDFSMEVCSGPHVENTSELVHFKIKKEEGISAGVRRIRAVVE